MGRNTEVCKVVMEQYEPGKLARVLLVQDDVPAGTQLGQMLREVWPRGLIVSQAREISDAAHELADHGATCVLLDIPHDDAPLDALEQLTTASPGTPIIVLSDHAGDELGAAAVRGGAQDYLLKSELSATTLGRAVRYSVERKRAEVALSVQALHDPLTELPNRALFLDRLRGALDRSRRTGSTVAVLFLDVDGFKEINDTFGHAAGDRVLMVLADRFRDLLRPMDTVARFGGDEFTFLFEGLETERDAALVAERVSQAVELPLTLAGGQHELAVSIGVTMVSDPQTAIDDIIRQADTAMYRAKEGGGDQFELFASVTDRTVGPRTHLEQELRQAVDRAELRVHYQPRVSLNGETGLEGFEALVRWEHPDLGLMEPVEFISIAEETGLIVEIGEWVMRQALEQLGRWRRSRPEVTISVNLSARQLGDGNLVEHLADAIREEDTDPAALCLEIAEGALEAAPALATRQLMALHEMGVKLAVDNFGTGTSSMTLSELPVDILKIDQTLISRLDRAGSEADTVGAAVRLGHELGLRVVAEGVETDAQLAQLRVLGCDGAQGYLFSHPITEEGVHSLLGES
jgi:diguanylate cyclase (GGDEF)-like protein